MPRRFVDLSVSLKAGIASDPPRLTPKIEYLASAGWRRAVAILDD